MYWSAYRFARLAANDGLGSVALTETTSDWPFAATLILPVTSLELSWPPSARDVRSATVPNATNVRLVAPSRVGSFTGAMNEDPNSFWSKAGSRNRSEADAEYCLRWLAETA